MIGRGDGRSRLTEKGSTIVLPITSIITFVYYRPFPLTLKVMNLDLSNGKICFDLKIIFSSSIPTTVRRLLQIVLEVPNFYKTQHESFCLL